jgi:2-C-methyl-D-erythritol 4-phosphate cytidylyltransferase
MDQLANHSATATAKIAAIVPAAGCGARAARDGKHNGNKVLAPLCGQPLLFWTLRGLLDSAPRLTEQSTPLLEILIAARRDEFALIEPILEALAAYSAIPISLVEGGAVRQQSVFNAARAAMLEAEYFLVHDAARPLASPELIARVCRAAKSHGAAIAALGASDTVKTTVEENGARFITSTPDRRDIYLAQTPQVFRRELFIQAFERAAAESFEGTDCASLIERNGGRVAIVEGELSNFKVTFAADLERAERLIAERSIS